MAVSSTWILSLKVLLISIGVVSIAMMMKYSVPLIVDFVIYEIPAIWSSLISWLRPPYLYFIINGIIIIIAATSRFHHKLEHINESEPLVSSKPPLSDLHSGHVYAASSPPELTIDESPAAYESEDMVAEVKTVVLNGPEAEDEDESFVISRSTWTPPLRMNSPEIQLEDLSPTPEKPLVSSRFGHRKPLKASPEGGRALRVSKPRRHETFENTWKTITDGRHMPLTRYLRKSDTWDHHGRHINTTGPQDLSPQIVKKSETFRDRTNHDPSSSPGSDKIRKEPSLSQDDLNRRVEAFIKKFNQEMRLQRQESMKQYMEMINRGAH